MASAAKATNGAALKRPDGGLSQVLFVYWPALFALVVALVPMLLDVERVAPFPPALDLSMTQARKMLTSPWFLSMTVPMCAGLVWLQGFARRHGLPAEEHRSMVWWLVNFFWFHVGCDIFSGFLQVMPVLTALYAKMTPAHLTPRWSAPRMYLDCTYFLEAVLEVPLAGWVLWLYTKRDPARKTVEAIAAAVQFAGTVVYYAPAVLGEPVTCWLSWVDRLCGSVWIVFPALLVWQHVASVQNAGRGKGD
mmetsp:Transcript_35051/g.81363  ORF Transcript_35051/g.81363 Transcript_35051/m.81363 type:complete len:249 (+) Transcript_35051:47-793(+)|eukprot:CAMPEP_0171068278 /NCGR_PEP_ID=MMETSP0766_2-20121228/8472_1 /TAXON_ID=439317 /ORGANISM="Gambierdiscus australes, Strain CAWD 149" /LENGTH=248 /DNA_ID=CAMNT_0011524575 /DNA_START=37 /DNA_END=783 /DNA_ORIENTATION=-